MIGGTRLAGDGRVQQSLIVGLALCSWWGCTAPEPDPGGGDAATADAGTHDAGSDPGPCPPGSTRMQYSLTPVDPLPSVSMLVLPHPLPSTEIVAAGTGGAFSARFDVCDDGGGAKLRALLVTAGALEAPSLYRWDDTIDTPVERVVEVDEGFVFEHRLPPSAFSVTGLEAALAGDLAALKVRLISESGLLIVGQEGFLALASGRVGADSIEYTSIFVVVGGLAPGDVFANLECGFSEQPLATSFTMATAVFDVQACAFLGEGETTGYRITSFAVQDSSSELSETERQRQQFTGEAEVESVLDYVYNHHNACDSFHLALPGADYAATTSPLAGCGNAVPDAPQRNFNEDPTSPVKFRIRYHGGAWMEGEMTGCTHYLFCN